MASKRRQLWEACEDGNEEEVKRLIREGVDIDCKDRDGDTPLTIAAMEGKVGCVRLLLDNGANINNTNDFGNTALLWATFNGYDEIVRLLIQRGVDIHIKGHNEGFTPLGWAKHYNDTRAADSE